MVDAVSAAAPQGVISTQMSLVQHDKPTASAAPAPPQADPPPPPSGGRGQKVDVSV